MGSDNEDDVDEKARVDILIRNARKESMITYGRIFAVFLWISFSGVVAIALLDVVAISLIFYWSYDIMYVSNYIDFVISGALLLGGCVVATVAAICTCKVTIIKAKRFLGLLICFNLTTALIVSSMFLINKMYTNRTIEFVGENSGIGKVLSKTIFDESYKQYWVTIHDEFQCCGLQSIDDQIHSYGILLKSPTKRVYFQKILRLLVEISNENSTATKEKCLFDFKNNFLSLNDTCVPALSQAIFSLSQYIFKGLTSKNDHEKLALSFPVNLALCDDFHHRVYRGCASMITATIKKRIRLLQLFARLLLSMIIVAKILCIMGFVCFKNTKIYFW